MTLFSGGQKVVHTPVSGVTDYVIPGAAGGGAGGGAGAGGMHCWGAGGAGTHAVSDEFGTTETVRTKPDEHTEAMCADCGKGAPDACEGAPLSRCSGCKSVWYCDARCQKLHWKRHKPRCRALSAERRAYKKERKTEKGTKTGKGAT